MILDFIRGGQRPSSLPTMALISAAEGISTRP
jgi:hypothetical protein